MANKEEPYGTFRRKEPQGEYIRDDGVRLDPLLAQAMNDMMKDFQASKQYSNEPIRIIGLAIPPEDTDGE